MARMTRVLCIGVAIAALVGCKGSPNIALPPPPAPRAFVTNSHTPLSFCTFCFCCGVFSNPCGGLSMHRHPLGTQRRQPAQRGTIHLAGARIPMTIAANLLNVYTTPLNPGGTPSFMLGTSSGLKGRPGGVAVDSAGNLYVIDFANNGGVKGTIFVFRAPVTSASVAAFSFPAAPGGSNAFAIAFDPKGRLWATDKGCGIVNRFDPPFSACSTPTLRWLGAGCPAGIAFDRSGALYVADEGSSRVRVWRADQTNGSCGCFVCAPTPAALVFAGCGTPTSVAFDAAQRLFVGHKENGLISVLSPPFGTTTNPAPHFTMSTDHNLFGSGFPAIDQSNNLFIPFVGDFPGPNLGGVAVFIPPYSSSSTPIFVLTTSLNNPYGIAFGR